MPSTPPPGSFASDTMLRSTRSQSRAPPPGGPWRRWWRPCGAPATSSCPSGRRARGPCPLTSSGGRTGPSRSRGEPRGPPRPLRRAPGRRRQRCRRPTSCGPRCCPPGRARRSPFIQISPRTPGTTQASRSRAWSLSATRASWATSASWTGGTAFASASTTIGNGLAWTRSSAPLGHCLPATWRRSGTCRRSPRPPGSSTSWTCRPAWSP
mmetsp:Transcript_5975/g.17136  ORF Transcript_5975/g.17136 Transcript_5975/m.17136 type:complete len:210 (+) Transcript_5975:886-1515(+)